MSAAPPSMDEGSFFTDQGQVSVDDPDSEALLKLLENSSEEEGLDPRDEAPAEAADDGVRDVLDAEPAAPEPAPAPPTVAAPTAEPLRVFRPAARRPEARFEEHLESLLMSFKDQALQEWGDSETDLRAQFRAAMDADRLTFEAQLAEKTSEIAELRRQNEALTLALDLKRNQGKRIMTLASRVRKDERRRHLLDVCFRRWRYWRVDERSDAVKASLGDGFRKLRVLERSLGGWRREIANQVKARTVASMRAQWQTEKTQLIALSDLNRQRDVEEMERLKIRLAEEERSKLQLQDDLKSVFMRGVCTLNFEAMQLLSGQPETGPLPVTPPAAVVPAPPAAVVPAPAPAPPTAAPEEPAAAEEAKAQLAEEPKGVEAMSAALQSSRKEPEKEKEPLAAVENKQAPAPRVVNASQAVKWQTASGSTIPTMSVIRPERRK